MNEMEANFNVLLATLQEADRHEANVRKAGNKTQEDWPGIISKTAIQLYDSVAIAYKSMSLEDYQREDIVKRIAGKTEY
jgi:hypothetical protein